LSAFVPIASPLFVSSLPGRRQDGDTDTANHRMAKDHAPRMTITAPDDELF
jgi:hypothetical protein